MADTSQTVALLTSTMPALIGFAGVCLGIAVSFVSRRGEARDRREVANEDRKIAAISKLSDYREAWIQRLRTHFATFYAIGTSCTDYQERVSKLSEAEGNILLMLNPNDEDFDELVSSINKLGSMINEDGYINPQLQGAEVDFLLISQRILKKEWDRIRSDMQTGEVFGRNSES